MKTMKINKNNGKIHDTMKYNELESVKIRIETQNWNGRLQERCEEMKNVFTFAVQ